jgi:hypothetical protein
MKKSLIIFLLLGGLLILGCQKRLKNTKDYHPTLQLTVESVPGGQQVTVEVIDLGAAPIEVVGFCFSSSADFSIEENQQIQNAGNSYTFSYTYPNAFFEEGGSYYFKAFTTSEYGYIVSNVVYMDEVEFLSVEAPCTQQEYRFRLSGSLSNIIGTSTAVSQSFDYIEYRNYVDGGPAVIGIQFRSQPATGIYSSSQYNYDLSPTEARIYMGMNGVTLEGGSIYVNHLGGNEYRVQACDVPFKFGSTNTTMDAHWIIKI